MDEKLLSIIIPTYNMENYIWKCLDSLLVPSIDKLDIIVVNDGSKDKSSEIAHSYAKRYPDSIRVIDKENGNYGSCINAALPTIKGKYVKILDADDTFDTNNLEKFIELLSKVEIDVILTDFIIYNSKGETLKLCKQNNLKSNSIKIRETHKIKDLCNVSMHAITFKKSLFENIDYHQTEGISYTDNEWIFLPFAFAQEIIYSELVLYRLLRGRAGQTMDPEVISKQISHYQPILVWMMTNYDKYKDKLEEANKNYLFSQILYIASVIYHKYLFSNNEENNSKLKEFNSFLEKNYQDFHRSIVSDIKIEKLNINIIKHWINHNFKIDSLLFKVLFLINKIRKAL